MSKGDRATPLTVNRGRGLIEVLCRHGVGHPSPRLSKPGFNSVHGCDGCCSTREWRNRERWAAEGEFHDAKIGGGGEETEIEIETPLDPAPEKVLS